MIYYHHGIFLGHTIGVADFGTTNITIDAATPRIVDILHFKGNRPLIRYIYTKCLSPEEAARNAEDLTAEPQKWGRYDLIRNNCEHFATRCKIGRAVSFQVLKKLRESLVFVLNSIGDMSSASIPCSVVCARDSFYAMRTDRQ